MTIPKRCRHIGVAAVATLAMVASVCAISAASATTTKNTTTATTQRGTANVAYAGSLELLAQKVLAPRFKAATDDSFQGRAAGSSTLAAEILSNEISPGVFMSVGKKNIKKLWPTDRSRFVIQLATDPLVVAYNPKSKYASKFAAVADHKKPLSYLFSLLSTKGLRIGRTDPNADPQGVYFILMMKLAESTLHLKYNPATTALGVTKASPFGKTSQMVDEDSLVTDLQAGEFDASSAYLTQAVQYHLHYITLPASLNFSVTSQSAHYARVQITLTGGTVDAGDLITLNITSVRPASAATAPRTIDQNADNAFVAWILSKDGRYYLKKGGYLMTHPVYTGAPISGSGTSTYAAKTTLPANVLRQFTQAGGTSSS